MLPHLLGLCLALAPQAGESGSGRVPAADEIARARSALDEAYRSRDAKRIQAALEAAHAVPDASVVRQVLPALEDERAEVKLAALQALRWIEHRDALEALHRATKDRKLMKVPELAAAVLRGIGQHADASSVAVLARDPFEPLDSPCLRARLFGLGRIRTRESIEALIGILGVTAPGSGQRRIAHQMEDARIALAILTGVDQGRSPELWESWWRANRKTFRVPEEPPLLPKQLRGDWDGFWGLPRVYERDPRREDRGQEPARPRKE